MGMFSFGRGNEKRRVHTPAHESSPSKEDSSNEFKKDIAMLTTILLSLEADSDAKGTESVQKNILPIEMGAGIPVHPVYNQARFGLGRAAENVAMSPAQAYHKPPPKTV